MAIIAIRHKVKRKNTNAKVSRTAYDRPIVYNL